MSRTPASLLSPSERCFRAIISLALCASVVSCDRKKPESTMRSGPAAALWKPPFVASLVPAATDLLVGMNAADHLIAISNWDTATPAIEKLQRVGDYRNIDWERITQLHPQKMIVQFAPEKMPAGLEQRCGALKIDLVNVRLNRLADIFDTLSQLGAAIDETKKSNAAGEQLRIQLDSIAQRVSNEPKISTLIVRSEGSSNIPCVGRDNFLDDLLTLSGGENALTEVSNPYPTIDQEKLATLDPPAILVLLPGEPPQVIEQAKTFWNNQPTLRAARDHRIFILTDSYLLLPGLSVGRIAEDFAARLHPSAATRPAGHA